MQNYCRNLGFTDKYVSITHIRQTVSKQYIKTFSKANVNYKFESRLTEIMTRSLSGW